ncbi:Pentatricopeptide repeat-containing protein, mitochondrial [Sesamum alatum]|uniref:Pentatricopeptide repeat-containing protein, mitochondrial n=1 Tax=Sesamum alatum TaxID=300844 RepID=A0AAE2C8E3_9LAMI|nr:Pentatricopeptide repeat-containing protein, mitochondrial [Sesamum alatum]
MQTSFRASRTLRHGLNVIKPTPLCMHVLGENYIKLQDDHPLKFYNSVGRTQRNSEFLIPREDYTLKQDVAKANWMITKLCQEAMMSGYWKTGRVSDAERLFDEMPDKNVVAWNTMIDGYVRNDRIEQALELFERMEERNVVSWNMVISGLNGALETGWRLFNHMPAKNVISWTAMISGCVRYGKSEEALKTFYYMSRDRKVKPNEGTFVSVLGACSDLAGLSEGMQVHQVISKTVYQEINPKQNSWSRCDPCHFGHRANSNANLLGKGHMQQYGVIGMDQSLGVLYMSWNKMHEGCLQIGGSAKIRIHRLSESVHRIPIADVPFPFEVQ